jgi:type IV secretory pathway VirJ component
MSDEQRSDGARCSLRARARARARAAALRQALLLGTALLALAPSADAAVDAGEGAFAASAGAAADAGEGAFAASDGSPAASDATPAASDGTAASRGTPSETFNYGRFGVVTVYRGGGDSAGEPNNVVLFVSGDGGWNLGVISMAERLVATGTLVAGIDIRHYLAQLEKSSDKCVSPAVDFENLSHYLQAKLHLKEYVQPTLVGYSSGATLVYATLGESPEGLFKGALSIGFCPDLDLKKPVCRGSGIEATPRRDSKGVLKGVDFLPVKQLPGQWISLQGEVDQVCPAAATEQFIESVPGGEIVMLPKVGHGYSVQKNWVPQFEAAYSRLTATRAQAKAAPLPAPVADLPLILIPAEGADSGDWFGVFLTGDGGWVGLDKGVAAELATHGLPIVGWDSLKYFWTPRTPEGSAKDLDRVLRHFAQTWGKARALLIGYSQGADTLPFMVNRLPPATRRLVGLTALLGISDNAVFEFHLANWLGEPAGGLPTEPELARWSGSPYLCLYGEDDRDSACKQLTGHDGSAVEMAGGHHFGGDYSEIANIIWQRLSRVSAP